MTIINSIDVPTYMIMLLVIFGMDVYTLIKYRKVKAPLESGSIFTTGYIDCYGHKQSYKGIRTVYSFT
jgi:hypothetical protein